VNRNPDRDSCVICHDSPSTCVKLDCRHTTCLECFPTYCQQMLEQAKFRMVDGTGYTVACPMYGCSEHVMDPHHFYLLGLGNYRRYKQQGAQVFLAREPRRHYCPNHSCGAGFTVDETGDQEGLILCPECNSLHCRSCGELKDNCNCLGADKIDPSAAIIQSTTKNCPQCQAATEKNGGCAHMECLQCKTEWCFTCGDLWSTKCQWDHWFS